MSRYDVSIYIVSLAKGLKIRLKSVISSFRWILWLVPEPFYTIPLKTLGPYRIVCLQIERKLWTLQAYLSIKFFLRKLGRYLFFNLFDIYNIFFLCWGSYIVLIVRNLAKIKKWSRRNVLFYVSIIILLLCINYDHLPKQNIARRRSISCEYPLTNWAF